MNKWYLQANNQDDVAVSTRVRLARNLRAYPFEGRMTSEQKKKLLLDVKTILENANLKNQNELRFIELDKLTREQTISLVERHLISPAFAQNTKDEGLVLSDDESIAVMLNEEDHIRIQALGTGLSLKETLEAANQLDDIFDASLLYAFDQKLGYLTHCPTNLGTGLRASVMLHLPALEANGVIGRITQMVSKLGLTIRGTYGEGTRVNGSFYQLSNQVTLGISEEGAIENLGAIASQIIAQERTARSSESGDYLEDKVWRAYGVLSSARLLSGEEFVELISMVRMGVSLGIIKGLDLAQVNALINETGAATLMANAGRLLSDAERDKMRAQLVRERLYDNNTQ